MGDGVVLDVRRIDRVAGITEADVRAELERIDYALKPFDIVLVRTDVSERYDEPGLRACSTPACAATRRRTSSGRA